MSNRPAKIYFDPYLFFSLFALSILGLFFLYSASNGDTSIVLKQSVYIFFGFCLGYGTFAPKTIWGQIFVVIFAIIGIPSSGLTLVHLADAALTCVTRLFTMGSDKVQKAFNVFDTEIKNHLTAAIASQLFDDNLANQIKDTDDKMVQKVIELLRK